MIQIKKTILTLVALLAVTTGAWADETYTITFAANGNTKTVENVTLPKTFQCSYSNANGELDLILKELYGWTGDSGETVCANWSTPTSSDANKVVAGKNGSEHYITINNVFEGTVTITGDYYVNYSLTSYSLEISIAAVPVTAVDIAWDKAEKTGTFKMPGGNVTLEPEYYPQAALTAAPTAINDVPATTDGAIVKAGTVANIGSTETAQGTVMYYVSTTALDDAALLALAADQWKADVPTAEKLAQGQAYVYYYVRGNDSDTDEENFSDGDILSANALQVTLGAAPLWNAEFDLTDAPEADKAGKWSTNIPEGGVVKGTPVTVTYTGSKKVIGVKAEKKAAAPASTPLDNTTTAWTAGTFAVPAGGLTYSDAITVSGDVTLTLTDGETLTLNKGISLASGATLTIQGNGAMIVNGTNNSTASTVAGSTGTLILTSGTLTAKGGNGQNLMNDVYDYDTGASGGVAINGNVTVSGGTVNATGGNGGNLYAQFGIDYAHAGNGGAAISGSLTINAGEWTATNGTNGSFTGKTDSCDGCSAGTGGKAVVGTVTDNR